MPRADTGSTIDVEAVAAILGGEEVLKDEVHDLGDLERVVARGLPPEALRRTVRSTVGDGEAARGRRERRAQRHRGSPPRHPRAPRSSSARSSAYAALMSARCVSACGKLPRWSPAGPSSSA